MKIMLLSDIHNNDDFNPVLDKLNGADLVLCAGDLTHFGKADRGIEIAKKLQSINKNIYFVSGNCDEPVQEKILLENGLSIHGRTVAFSYFSPCQCNPYDDFLISGIGGSLTTPMSTPNTWTENELVDILSGINPGTDILLSHQPPYGSSADIVMKVLHTGSKNLRNFILKNKPRLCVCGHIHESYGISKIGETWIVNPGSYKEWHYALVEMPPMNETLKKSDIQLF